MEIASFEKFLVDKIKVGNKTGERLRGAAGGAAGAAAGSVLHAVIGSYKAKAARNAGVSHAVACVRATAEAGFALAAAGSSGGERGSVRFGGSWRPAVEASAVVERCLLQQRQAAGTDVGATCAAAAAACMHGVERRVWRDGHCRGFGCAAGRPRRTAQAQPGPEEAACLQLGGALATAAAAPSRSGGSGEVGAPASQPLGSVAHRHGAPHRYQGSLSPPPAATPSQPGLHCTAQRSTVTCKQHTHACVR